MTKLPQPSPPVFFSAEGPVRHRPAEYVRDGPGVARGWYQDGRRLRQVKASKAFIWPKDGKNGTKWGRMKDIIRGEGPDMFVAFGASQGDCISNRPSRAQWSMHQNFDDTGVTKGFDPQKFAPWTKNAILGGRVPGKCYDFRTRKHMYPDGQMWSDAIWQREPYKNRKSNVWPEALRTMGGDWYQDAQHLPQFLGGRVGNEFGRGIPGYHLPLGLPFISLRSFFDDFDA